jgi:23S rRNA-/tRNA-specific pseudouridylate synthase
MLQRIRLAVHRPINLIHRLDRGTSGCLLCCYADDDNNTTESSSSSTKTTSILSTLLQDGQKTYLALVRGEGMLHGIDLKQRGWFTVDRPIKDEKGILNNATTEFWFVAGQDNQQKHGHYLQNDNTPRASLVLARPKRSGRWHQVRRHLNGLSHPILGDTTHGDNKVNREWKEKYGLKSERICLHLLRMKLPASSSSSDSGSSCRNDVAPLGIDVTCPLPEDMMTLLEQQIPKVLEQAEPLLLQHEGIQLRPPQNNIESSGRSPPPPRVLPYELEVRNDM